MKSKLIYFGVIIFLFFFSIASADDGFFAGEGETVWPIESKEIEMLAETVKVQSGEIGWEAKCIFILRNTGEEIMAQVGFPDIVEEGDGADTSKGTIENFRCFVDGKEVQTEHKKGVQNSLKPELKYPFAYVWKVFFKKGEIKIITNTYAFRGSGTSDGMTILTYILKTGALWKGLIKNAVIEFDLGRFKPDLCYSIKPPGYVIEGNKIKWYFSDFEPDKDIEILFNAYVISWLKQVEEYLLSDSIEVLRNRLNEGLFEWKFYIYPKLLEKFNRTVEKIIKKLEPLMDVEIYRIYLDGRNENYDEVKRRCENYLRKFVNRKDFTLEEEYDLSKCIDISLDPLRNYDLAEQFLGIQLRIINEKINSLSTFRDSNTTRKEVQNFIYERESIIRSIDFCKRNKLENKSKVEDKN